MREHFKTTQALIVPGAVVGNHWCGQSRMMQIMDQESLLVKEDGIAKALTKILTHGPKGETPKNV